MELGDIINKHLSDIADSIVQSESMLTAKALSKKKRTRRNTLNSFLGAGYGLLDLPVDKYQDALHNLTEISGHLTNPTLFRKFSKEMESNLERMDRMLVENYKYLNRAIDAGLALGLFGLSGITFMGSGNPVLIYSSATAGIAYGIDACTNQGKAVTIPRAIGFLASFGPVVEYLRQHVQYDLPLTFKNIMIASAPVNVALAEILRTNLIIDLKANKITEMINNHKETASLSRELKNRFKRVRYVLNQVEEVQNLEEINNHEGMEQVLVLYLNNQANKGDVKRERYNLVAKVQKPRFQIVDKKVVEKRPKQLREQFYDNETYARLTAYGLEDDISKRISRAHKWTDLEDMDQVLKSSLGGNYQPALTANPALIMYRNSDRSQYLEKLHHMLNILNLSKELDTDDVVSRSITQFASADGIEYFLTNWTEDEEPEAKQFDMTKEGYDNHELVEAILRKGFLLGTSTPKISMAYRPIRHIRNQTTNSIGSGISRGFDKTFGKLKRDGAIWMERDKKGTEGGRYSGCYSITPHFGNIKNNQLREFIRHIHY